MTTAPLATETDLGALKSGDPDWMLGAASAAVRSGSSSKRTSSRPWWYRVPETVNGRPLRSSRRRAPVVNRRSGSSVRTSTDTSPDSP